MIQGPWIVTKWLYQKPTKLAGTFSTTLRKNYCNTTSETKEQKKQPPINKKRSNKQWKIEAKMWENPKSTCRQHPAYKQFLWHLTCFFPCFERPKWLRTSLSSFIRKYANFSCNGNTKVKKFQMFCNININTFKSFITRNRANRINKKEQPTRSWYPPY